MRYEFDTELGQELECLARFYSGSEDSRERALAEKLETFVRENDEAFRECERRDRAWRRQLAEGRA